MLKFIVKLLNGFLVWLFKRENFYRSEYVSDIPKNPQPYRVYILGGEKSPFLAVIQCPCGCGESLHMNLLSSRDPCWELSINKNGSVTFKPSLWKRTGCRSHFHLINGEIRWTK